MSFIVCKFGGSSVADSAMFQQVARILKKDPSRRYIVLSAPGKRDSRDKKITEDTVSFLYSGDMNRLLRALSSGEIADLTVSEPDLEEIFLHYYENGGENK